MPYKNRIFNLLTTPADLKENDFTYRESRDMIFAKLPRLETERLILRSLSMHDAPDVYAYSKDPRVAQYVLWDAHRSIAETRGYLRSVLRQYRAGEPTTYGIVLKKTGKVIGTIGFMWLNEENQSAEIGYSLSRIHWNQGLMTEALRALLGLCFRRLALNRVEAQHDTRNPASGRVMQRCGMTKEGTLRQRLYSKGVYVDVDIYAVLAADYGRSVDEKQINFM
ncbi:MAG: GNAT family N-acetyltransferase [Clostridia bacterium]|nr:GNAT family N-acetyltransferase [Clostridia bacterium]